MSSRTSKYSVILNHLDSHHAVANNLIHELTEGLAKLLVQAHPHHKRQTTQGLSDLLGQVGQTLASFFQPHIEAAKQVCIKNSFNLTGVVESSKMSPFPIQTCLQFFLPTYFRELFIIISPFAKIDRCNKYKSVFI